MRARALSALSVAVVGAVVGLTGCSGSDTAASNDDVIRMAALPLTDDPTVETPVEAMAELLEAETGKTVEVVDVPNYSAVIEAVRSGHEDIGMMSGFPSALAVNTGEVDSLVAWPGLDEPVSTCLVLADSPIKTLADITPGMTIAMADPASSSGFFMPTHLLNEAGLAEKDGDFEQLFAGGHDRALLALKQGQADVTCTSATFPEMAGQGNPMFPFEVGETRSIGESISMPISVSFLGSRHMSDAKRTALVDALPKVFSDANRDRLGLYMEAMPAGVEPILEPDREQFAEFIDIAAVAGVDISDLE